MELMEYEELEEYRQQRYWRWAREKRWVQWVLYSIATGRCWKSVLAVFDTPSISSLSLLWRTPSSLPSHLAPRCLMPTHLQR